MALKEEAAPGPPANQMVSGACLGLFLDCALICKFELRLENNHILLTSKYQKKVEILYGSDAFCESANREDGRCT